MPRTQINYGAGGTPNAKVAEHNFYDLRHVFPTTGNIWFVDSGASASGTGLSPEDPVTTINAAVALATASNGDIIVVMEGHAESVTAAAGVALSKAGLTVVGLGRGRNRPVITFTTAAAASLDISAASCHLENLTLACNIDDQTAMVNVTAADVTIRNCELVMGDATYDAESGITVTASGDRLLVEGCHLHSESATAITAGAITFGACDNAVIRGCIISGLYGTAGAVVNSAAAANVMLIGNKILNQSADGNNKAIVLHASTTGLIADNRGGIIDSTSPAPVTAAAAWVAGNYWSSAVGVTASTLM